MRQYIILHYVHILVSSMYQNGSWRKALLIHTHANAHSISPYPSISTQWQHGNNNATPFVWFIYSTEGEEGGGANKRVNRQRNRTAEKKQQQQQLNAKQQPTPTPPHRTEPNPIEFRWRRCELCAEYQCGVHIVVRWPFAFVYARNI